MLSLNGVFAYVASATDETLKSPFNGQPITPVTQPRIYDHSNQAGTLYSNITNIRNSTSGNPFSFFTESLYWSLGLLQTFYNFIGGGFLWSSISVIGVPEAFLASTFWAVEGFFIVITVAHFVTGRF
ncbi:MAG: hypothetical protein ABI337_01605 [Nitrososphaera sp.]